MNGSSIVLKRVAVCSAVLLGAFALQAAIQTTTWIGGASGNWADADNWDNGAPAAAADQKIACFTNSATVDANGWYHAYGVKVLSGDVTVNGSGQRFWCENGGDDGIEFYVGEGASLTMGEYFEIISTPPAKLVFRKTGKGALTVQANVGDKADNGWYNGFQSVEVREGTLVAATTAANFQTYDDRVKVYRGAMLKLSGAPSAFSRNAKAAHLVWLEEGAVFDGGLQAPTLTGVLGAGEIRNMGWSGNTWMTLKPEIVDGKSTMQFTGTFVDSYVLWAPTDETLKAQGLSFNTRNSTFVAPVDGGQEKLVLAGGNHEGINVNPAVKTFETRLTGGTYDFRSYTPSPYNRTWTQTGGDVKMWPLMSSVDPGETYGVSSNEMFYTISGGAFTSTVERRSSYGLGMDVKGTADVTLKSGTYGEHVLLMGPGNRRLRVSEDATLWVDSLTFGLGDGCVGSTGTVEVAGGTMVVDTRLGYSDDLVDNSRVNPAVAGRLLFNGGTVVSCGNGFDFTHNAGWPTYGWQNADQYAREAKLSEENMITLIGEKGGTLKVSHGAVNRRLRLASPVRKADADKQAGPFVKDGEGVLVFARNVDTDGPVVLKAGTLENASADDATPFGTGDLVVGSGQVTVGKAQEYETGCTDTVRLAADAGAKLVYTNGALLRVRTSATVGADDAAADAALVRGGHGILVLAQDAANATLGGDMKVRVNGGMAVNAAGLPVNQAVFGRAMNASCCQNLGYHAGSLSLLTYDDANGFVTASLSALAPGGSATTLAHAGGAAKTTLAENATVGGLVVDGPYAKGNNGGLKLETGVTVTVGNGTGVAPLVLNNMPIPSWVNEGTGACRVEGGAFDFGAAEGVVAMNQRSLNMTLWDTMVLASTLRGSGGVTFAAAGGYMANGLKRALELTGANEYTGGTWIEGAAVRIKEPTGFGASGTVTVEGDEYNGGRAVIRTDYTSDTFVYPLVLSGAGQQPGPVSGFNGDTARLEEAEDGAFAALKSVKATGGVTLAADARVMAGGGATLDFAAAVTGPGGLEIVGAGAVRLSAANSYAGETVIDGGTLELTAGGTVPGNRVTLRNGGKVRFVGCSRPAGFAIEGDGTVEYVATGDMDFVKDDDGDSVIFTPSDHTGDTTVAAGTLHLAPYAPEALPFAEAVVFRLDASDGATVTRDDNVVSAWSDADGREDVFAPTKPARAPLYDAEAFGGLGGVTFSSETVNDVADNTARSFATVFVVVKPAEEKASWASAPMLGLCNTYVNWCSLHPLDATTWDLSKGFGEGARLAVNGTVTDAFTPGQEQVVSLVMAAEARDLKLALCEEVTWDNQPFFAGTFGEVVAYDRALGDDERSQVEQFLMAKWGIAPEKAANPLPTTTALTVAEGATLDLAGANQKVATLELSGTIENTSETVSVLRLEDGVSHVTGGTFGDGTGIELHVAKNAILDLGGATIYVDYLRCLSDRSNILNGTIVVNKAERRPFPYGMSIIIR